MSESSSGGGLVAAIGCIGCLSLMLCTGLLGAGGYWLMSDSSSQPQIIEDVFPDPLE